MCLVLFSEQTVIIYVHSINWLLFNKRDGVYLVRGVTWVFKYDSG